MSGVVGDDLVVSCCGAVSITGVMVVATAVTVVDVELSPAPGPKLSASSSSCSDVCVSSTSLVLRVVEGRGDARHTTAASASCTSSVSTKGWVGVRGACVVRAWWVRGGCVVRTWCVRGACVVRACLSVCGLPYADGALKSKKNDGGGCLECL